MVDIIYASKPSKRGTLPAKWFCFDSETAGLYGKALLICLIGSDGTKETFEGDDAAEQFKEWIDTHRKRVKNAHFYAHNLEFDLVRVLGNVISNPKTDVIMAGSRLISATYKIRTRKLASGKTKHEVVTFLDSFNLLPKSLSKIGESLGYEKYETPKKWFSDNMTSDQIDDEDRVYCMRDCEVLQKFIYKFAEFVAPFHTSVKSTVASNAKAMWASLYVTENIYINDDLDEQFRDSYYGGRTEVFISRIDTSELFHYDVNSLYPSVMKNNLFPDPTRLKEYINPTFEKLVRIMADNEGMAEVTVIAPNIHIPLLPYRTDKLLFPLGTFKGSYCFPELRYALKLGYKITEVHKIIAAPSIESPFTAYIEVFQKMKIEASLKGDEAIRQLAKTLMNSLYGKFAQRIPEEEQYSELMPTDENKTFWKQLPIGDMYFRKNVGLIRSSGTVVAWASYVCSYARCKLYDYLNANPHETYYCDTDSIFTSIPLPDEQVSETEFGLMNLEGMVSLSCFADPKKYFIKEGDETKRVIKGVTKEQKENLTVEDFIKDNIYVKGEKPSKLKESLKRGLEPYTKLEIEKVLVRHSSPKRIFGKNGDSRPITINKVVRTIPVKI